MGYRSGGSILKSKSIENRSCSSIVLHPKSVMSSSSKTKALPRLLSSKHTIPAVIFGLVGVTLVDLQQFNEEDFSWLAP